MVQITQATLMHSNNHLKRTPPPSSHNAPSNYNTPTALQTSTQSKNNFLENETDTAFRHPTISARVYIGTNSPLLLCW